MVCCQPHWWEGVINELPTFRPLLLKGALMSFRVPPNKGIIEFPCVLHVRCTHAMLDEVQARGGSRWIRALVAANTRPPAPVDPAPIVSPGIPSDTSPRIRKRVSRKPAGAKRVSLDKRKRRKA